MFHPRNNNVLFPRFHSAEVASFILPSPHQIVLISIRWPLAQIKQESIAAAMATGGLYLDGVNSSEAPLENGGKQFVRSFKV